MFSKQLIQQSFSNVASDYDNYAMIQRRIGDQLLKAIADIDRDYNFILDIGTGTAQVLGSLALLYPQAHVLGLDYSEGMLIAARANGARYLVQADAEYLPFNPKLFDLITSNLVYQWLPDLDKAFMEAVRILRHRGIFYFSIFGKDTLKELRQCISSVKYASRIMILPSENSLYNKLSSSGFFNIEITSELEQEFFPDFLSILRWLKLLGVNRAGVQFLGLEARGILKEMERLYIKHFSHNGKVIASFEKILIRAEKK